MSSVRGSGTVAGVGVLLVVGVIALARRMVAEQPKPPLGLRLVSLELSGIDRVRGGFLIAEDELVGSLVFMDDASLAKGAPQGRLVKLERRRKRLAKRARTKLFGVQDAEGVASDGDRTVYVLGSHHGSKKGGSWQRRPGREFIIEARWDPKGRKLVVPTPKPKTPGKKRKKKNRRDGLYTRFLEDLRADHGPAVLQGLNAEGLALRAGRLFVGLRSPLERGRALVFYAEAGHLFEGGRVRWQKLSLALGGQGVRGLHWDAPARRLLILGGPTTDRQASGALWAYDPKTRGLTRLRKAPRVAGGVVEGVCRWDAKRLLAVVDAEGASAAPLVTWPAPAAR